jgi:site-specific recombinase XerD
MYQYFSNDTTVTNRFLTYTETSKPTVEKKLLQSFKFHISSIEKLEGTQFAHNTIRKYKSVLNSLNRFLSNKDVKLVDLDYKFVNDYFEYLITKESLLSNSALKNLKCLYRVIHVCILNKWLTVNPFTEFKIGYKQPIRPYLTENEICSIYNHVFTTDKHIRVKDLFLFQIYTGLSYADMTALTTNNIEVGIDSKEWIVINRLKTGERSAIPLLPIALTILKKYNYVLPTYSNQKYNAYLKEVAVICNITKKITTHIGRHTFATTVCLGHGVPIETVSKLLGHSSLVTTQIYAKVTDRKTANDMKCLL